MIKFKSNQYQEYHSSQIVGWGHWVTLFNIIIVIGFGSQYFFIADWPTTLLGRIYGILSCVGHFSFITFIGYLLFIFPFGFFIRSIKWLQVFSALISTIFISYLLLDLEVYKLFRIHLNFSVFNLMISSDSGILYTKWQRLFIFIPLILLVELLFSLWSWRKIRMLNKRRNLTKPLVIIFTFSFVSFHLMHMWADATFYRPITMQRANLALYYPLTAVHLLEKYNYIDTEKYNEQVNNMGNPAATYINYPIHDLRYKPAEKSYNLLLIVIDDWYSSTLGNEQNEISVHPNIDLFANANTQFTQHISSSILPEMNEFSLYYGLDANYYNNILANKKPSVLIKAAIDHGYTLGLFSTNGFSAVLFKQAMLKNLVIDNHRTALKEISKEWISWFKQTNDKKEPITDTMKHKPWFSIVKYHNPSRVKTEIQAQNYMKQVDTSINDVLAELTQSNALSNTVVIITAVNKWQMNKKHPIYERSELAIPLIIAWPDRNDLKGSLISSQVDIAPTLLSELFKVENNIRDYSNGRNLFGPVIHPWVITADRQSIAALTKDKTLLIDSKGQYRVYDIDGNKLKNNNISFPFFLDVLSENRHFVGERD